MVLFFLGWTGAKAAKLRRLQQPLPLQPEQGSQPRQLQGETASHMVTRGRNSGYVVRVATREGGHLIRRVPALCPHQNTGSRPGHCREFSDQDTRI